MNPFMYKLEEFVDTHGLDGVISALSEICLLKYEHLSENWEDEEAAERWNKAAAALEKLYRKLNTNEGRM